MLISSTLSLSILSLSRIHPILFYMGFSSISRLLNLLCILRTVTLFPKEIVMLDYETCPNLSVIAQSIHSKTM